jgi:RNA polymerase sigma-70 factor (ECF subfamily)
MDHDEPARNDRTRSSSDATLDLPMLVAAMAGGSEAALAQLFDHCFDRIYGIVFRILSDASDAEEVVVEVFHQAWRSARAYDPARGEVTGWLAAIAWSRAIDRRRRMRGPVAGGAAHPIGAPDAYTDHEDLDQRRWFDAFEANQVLKDAVSSLSRAQRVVLGLAYFEGLSHSEIAQETGMPVGTVKSHARRAIEALRGAIGDGAGPIGAVARAPEHRHGTAPGVAGSTERR